MIRFAVVATSLCALAACSPPGPNAAEPPGKTEAGPAAGATPGTPDPAAAAAAGLPSEIRMFRDWMAVCDNANRCVALTGSGGEFAWLKVESPAGPEGRPAVTLRALNMDDGESLDGARLSIDGRPASADASAVPLLGQGRRAAIVVGDRERALSLNGAAAALLWIDERQGRLDTPIALVRRGDRPAGAVPAPPARPVVKAMPVPSPDGRTDRALPPALEALPAVVECRVDVPDAQAETWPLGASQHLWLVPCYRGAYNFGARLFIAPLDGKRARAVGLPTARGEPTPFVVNGGFDPATGVLDSFDKGRGIGDCGTARSWVWTGRGFVLTREAVMEECWGLLADEWPVAYEAVVQ